MGGVLLREGKNGGSILRGRKKWGEYTLAAEGRAIMSTPPLRVFLAPSLITDFKKIGLSRKRNISELFLLSKLPSFNKKSLDCIISCRL